MNFFGLLWVISTFSSFISPHEPPRTLEDFSRILSDRSIALISRVTGSSRLHHTLHQPFARLRSKVHLARPFSPQQAFQSNRASTFPKPKEQQTNRSVQLRQFPRSTQRLSTQSIATSSSSSRGLLGGSLWMPLHLVQARSPDGVFELPPSLQKGVSSSSSSRIAPWIALPVQFPPLAFQTVFSSVSGTHIVNANAVNANFTHANAVNVNAVNANFIAQMEWRTLPPATLEKSLANPVVQVVKNLLDWTSEMQSVFQVTAPWVMIVPAKNPCAISPAIRNRWRYESQHGIRELQLGQCTGLWQRDAALPEPVETVFQVRVKDQVIAELPTSQQAEAFARRLQQTLQEAEFDPAQILPTVMNGLPAGKAGDTLLFWVEPDVATLLDRNAELMAIAWINNLRAVLNTPTLPLTLAQSYMHRLMPTNQKIEGTASWYGPYFHGRLTATGEVFNQNDLTAAHPSLPFNTYLQVTNLLTNKTVIVRINDRGPYFEDRSLDLSREAARSLGSEAKGVVPYEAIIMERVDLAQRDSTQIEQTNSEAVQDLSPNRSQLSIQTLANRP